VSPHFLKLDKGGKSQTMAHQTINRAKWKDLLSGVLFSPPTEPCAYCGQPIRGKSNPLGLCPGCFAAIPWIAEIRCPICGRHEDCPDCKREYKRHFQISRSAVHYDDRMKEWLARYKYRGDERLAKLLGGMLFHGYAKLQEAVLFHSNTKPPEAGTPLSEPSHPSKKRTPAGPASRPFDLITYVPVSAERFFERGFNQAEQLARELSGAVGLPVVSLLTRTRSTAKQSFKTRGERLKDMGGAFAPNEGGIVELAKTVVHWEGEPCHFPKESIVPLRILLIDDVYTTGSTLNHCAAVLTSRLPAEVYGLTWAR
jgi:predicted amidophosphoribosyltransferase